MTTLRPEDEVVALRDEQIQWRHLDPVKFLGLNVLLHAGMDIFLYPPDVVRTRMQVQVLGEGQKNLKLSFPIYNNTWHCFRTIISQEGIRGLYKGFLVAEATYIAGNLFHYGGYEIIKEKLQQLMGADASHHKGHILWTTFTAGALADAASLTFMVPAEVVQQRLQIQGPLGDKNYEGGVDALFKIARSEGVRGLYRGTGAAFLVYAPASAIWWAAYELCKDWIGKFDLRSPLGLKPYKGGATGGKLQDEDPIVHGISGALASFLTRTLMNPIDIAKTRLQTQDMYAVGGPTHRTAVGVLIHMLKTEGLRSACKGLLPALMSSVPAGIANITIYEWAKKQSLKKEYQRKDE